MKIYRQFFIDAMVFFVSFAIITIAVTSTIQFDQQNNDRETAEIARKAPAKDFFQYTDIAVEPSYFTGEQLVFQSIHKGFGSYPATYIDKIFCPTDPKQLVATAFSRGSIKNTGGELETSKWVYGNFEQGERFKAITIDTPQVNCYIESVITIVDDFGNTKTQEVQSNNRFDIVEAPKDAPQSE